MDLLDYHREHDVGQLGLLHHRLQPDVVAPPSGVLVELVQDAAQTLAVEFDHHAFELLPD